jgi:hypothetical protein
MDIETKKKKSKSVNANATKMKDTKKSISKKKIIKSPVPSAKKDTVKIKKFKELEGNLLLVKVGNDALPAATEQIKDVQDKLVDLFAANDVNCLVFVTHHYVDMEIIEKR